MAVVSYVYPAQPPPFDKATTALSALEQKHFTPGTPANNLYQVALIPWNGLVLSVIVFPGAHLAELGELLQPHGLALTRGVPVMSGASGPEVFDVAQVVREQLNLDVGERRYCFGLRGDGPAIREAPSVDLGKK